MGDNRTLGQTRLRRGRRRRRRGGQAGGCEVEVRQEATWQPVGANKRQKGGGIGGGK
jgi:hypothetical protein